MQPFADLHRHLDGSLRETTLRALAEADGGVALPGIDELRFRAGMTLDEALARFEVTLSVLQDLDAVRRVADEICADAAADGVSTLEIRFAPQLHGRRGASIEDVVAAAVDGAAGRAGIILCGLYGEPPAVLDALVDAGARNAGVVGIDLAGGPSGTDDVTLTDYAPSFRRAAELGLGRTVHAGEGRPPAEIRTAIEELGAQRIGHGTSLLDDSSVLDLVLERGVTLEACPTSNVHTGIIATVGDHPIREWLRRGVQVTICTDNTLLSAVTASEEHRRVIDEVAGMTDALLAETVRVGHAAAFPRR